MKKLYSIPKLEQIDKFCEFSRNYNAGFEYNDFFLPSVLDMPEKVEQLIHAYTSLGRDCSEDTLHGVFLDICVNSDDSQIYRVSDYRIHQSMEIAEKLGVRAVIFHTNHIPNFRLKSYRDGWLKRNIAYWSSLLSEYPDITVYIENMFDEEPDLLCQLADALKDNPHFGACFDLAHAYLSSTPLPDWCRALLPYAKHLHINDNCKVEDTHHPVGRGTLPWKEYADFIAAIPEEKRPTVLIEVRGFEDLMASVRYMEEHRLYPF